jgi:HEAT repeat protein
MATKDVRIIVELLADESFEKAMAAAVILGELGHADKVVVDGLVGQLKSEHPVIRRPALVALGKIKSLRALPHLLDQATERDDEVKKAAQDAVVALGNQAVPEIKKRLPNAAPDARRIYDSLLARLGGKEAFAALLENLDAGDEEEARRAALAVRQNIKDAGKRERRTYLAHTEKFLRKKSTRKSHKAMSAALKILGYLEDDRALDTLLDHAQDEDLDPTLRQDAVVSVRFALSDDVDVGTVAEILLEIANDKDLDLARSALDTLSVLDLPDAFSGELAKLANHKNFTRARGAIFQLGKFEKAAAIKVLTRVMLEAERARAELAGQALADNSAAAPYLSRALAETDNVDRAKLIHKYLYPRVSELKKKDRDLLRDAAMDWLLENEPVYEPILSMARAADPEGVAEALREQARKFKKGRKPDAAIAVLQVLSKSAECTDEDRYLLASLDMNQSLGRDLRWNEDALRLLRQLDQHGFDLVAALRKDRSMDLDTLYQIGFLFADNGFSVGIDLLEVVVEKGGRKKVAKMAKNKLKLLDAA